MLRIIFVAAALTADVTPVEKVVTMLRDLQTQVQEEGKAEATTYDKFACFCKAKTDEKTDAITTGATTVSTLQSDLATYQSNRDTLNGQIDTLNTNIDTYNSEFKAATEMRESEKATFDAAFKDMTKAIGALERAIETLKASKSSDVSAYLQTDLATTVQKALLTADAFGIETDKSVLALLVQPTDDGTRGVANQDYEFKSGGIISTLEGLLGTFRTQKSTLESENAQAQSDFDLAAQGKTAQIKAAQVTLAEKEELRSTATKNIAEAQADLTETNAVLNDDRLYLKDLTSKCETKAKEWDQRSAMRSDELSAITQALAVIEGVVATKATETGVGGRDAMGSKGRDENAPSASSFLQVSVRKATQPADAEEDMEREKLVALLVGKAKELKSPALMSLATAAKTDVFAKVKRMIQELIERLLAEEADEADHKGWCDEELAKTTKDRDYRLRDVAKLHAELSDGYAKKDTLELNKKELTHQIGNLTADLATEQQNRNEEKAENEQTVSDAQEGVTAVQQAMDILSHFYGEAAKATVFTQQPADDAMPDAGWKTGEAYTGSQSASTGILGMLDVIMGDFKRTISETQAAEEQAKRDFVEFDRETQVSISTKTSALSNTNTELTATNNQIADNLRDLRTQQNLLDTAVQTWVDLLPQCVADPGMSYAERVEKRNQEIEALRSAYCILDNREVGCDGVPSCARRGEHDALFGPRSPARLRPRRGGPCRTGRPVVRWGRV